jgi:hypothetical protein
MRAKGCQPMAIALVKACPTLGLQRACTSQHHTQAPRGSGARFLPVVGMGDGLT